MIKYNLNNINDWNFDNSNITKVYRNNSVVYQKITTGDTPTPPVPPTPSQNYLTFVAKENGTFQFTNSVDYSVNNGNTWNSLPSNTSTPTVNEGDKIMWKSTLTPSSSGIGRFSSTGQFDAEGNAMSLLYGDNFVGETDLTGKNYAFFGLFSGCTGMTSAENLVLPATTLASHCYDSMFYNCTSLTAVPSILPATTLAEYCYLKMYNTCTSLTTVPSNYLPATTLVTQCYKNMFADCTSLTTAPEIPATIVATQCCENMFIHDASLTTAPSVLPAATLATRCYQGIFFGCSKLNYIKCLATNISASSCTSDWVTYVASTGTFVKAASMSSWPRNRNGIPSGWTVVDDV